MLLGRERREENRGTKDKVEEEERQRKKGEKGKQSTYLFSNPFSSNYRCRVSLSEARFQDENDIRNKVRLEGSCWHDQPMAWKRKYSSHEIIPRSSTFIVCDD